MNFGLIAFFKAVENMAIVAGATIAAIYFNKPAILLLYLLVLINGYNFESNKSNKQEDKNA